MTETNEVFYPDKDFHIDIIKNASNFGNLHEWRNKIFLDFYMPINRRNRVSSLDRCIDRMSNDIQIYLEKLDNVLITDKHIRRIPVTHNDIDCIHVQVKMRFNIYESTNTEYVKDEQYIDILDMVCAHLNVMTPRFKLILKDLEFRID